MVIGFEDKAAARVLLRKQKPDVFQTFRFGEIARACMGSGFGLVINLGDSQVSLTLQEGKKYKPDRAQVVHFVPEISGINRIGDHTLSSIELERVRKLISNTEWLQRFSIAGASIDGNPGHILIASPTPQIGEHDFKKRSGELAYGLERIRAPFAVLASVQPPFVHEVTFSSLASGR